MNADALIRTLLEDDFSIGKDDWLRHSGPDLVGRLSYHRSRDLRMADGSVCPAGLGIDIGQAIEASDPIAVELLAAWVDYYSKDSGDSLQVNVMTETAVSNAMRHTRNNKAEGVRLTRISMHLSATSLRQALLDARMSNESVQTFIDNVQNRFDVAYVFVDVSDAAKFLESKGL